jgi:hypothetical protein
LKDQFGGASLTGESSSLLLPFFLRKKVEFELGLELQLKVEVKLKLG